MKHMIFLALVSLAVTALAQEKPAAKAEAMKEATKPEAKQAATGPRMPHARRWHEDARHCLELPSNTEIIKCAEEYL